MPVEVTAVEQVTPLIKQFTLGPVAGGELPPFSGGNHVIVVLRRQDRTFRRPYSLMGSPRDRGRYRIAVRRHDHGRGGSLYLLVQVRVGTRLDVSHPVNLSPLARLARKHVLVAGCIGITPVTAMVDGLRGGRVPWELHYVVRGPRGPSTSAASSSGGAAPSTSTTAPRAWTSGGSWQANRWARTSTPAGRRE